jgi:hypothetical protein
VTKKILAFEALVCGRIEEWAPTYNMLGKIAAADTALR